MTPDALQLGTRLREEVLDSLKAAFVAKDAIIDLLGIALVGGENLFLLGPPGTAKSALVHELGKRLHGHTFEYLLTRFTEPSEIFGPFDIRALRDGDLITNTEGMLPEADLVFLDELLNANSAILNSLLTVLNERVFRRGRETRTLPTLMVVGASNHLPEDDALGALFDRFLLRVRCDNVDDEGLARVLDAGWQLDVARPDGEARFTVDDARALHALVPQVSLDAVRPGVVELVTRIRRAGLRLTDRRAVKLQRMIAASALLSGRMAAHATDLWVFRHVWDTLEQEEVLASIVERFLESAGDPDEGKRHPLSRPSSAPDPEALARDLAALEESFRALDQLDGDEREARRSELADRLGLLAERTQWVAGEVARAELGARVEVLWAAARAASDGSPAAEGV